MTPGLNDSLTTHRLGLGNEADHVETLAHRIAWRYRKSSDPHHSDTYTFNAATLLHFADALLASERERRKQAAEEIERLRRLLHEIAEEWAGAECGEPVHAQEAYAIGLAKRMYALAAEALRPNVRVQPPAEA